MDVDIGEIHFQTRRKDDFVHSFETLNLDCIHFISRMKHSGETGLDKIGNFGVFCTKDYFSLRKPWWK